MNSAHNFHTKLQYMLPRAPFDANMAPVAALSVAITETKEPSRKRRHVKWALRHTGRGLIGIFALIGLVFSGVFVAMQFGVFNVKGSISSRNEFFKSLPKAQVLAASVPKQATATGCVQQGS